MKTIRKVEIKPEYVHFMPSYYAMEENILYISKEFGIANHLCLCGCKIETVTPLGEGEWILTEKNGKVSLSPSIGNYQLPCNSHYILTNNIANFV